MNSKRNRKQSDHMLLSESRGYNVFLRIQEHHVRQELYGSILLLWSFMAYSTFRCAHRISRHCVLDLFLPRIQYPKPRSDFLSKKLIDEPWNAVEKISNPSITRFHLLRSISWCTSSTEPDLRYRLWELGRLSLSAIWRNLLNTFDPVISVCWEWPWSFWSFDGDAGSLH